MAINKGRTSTAGKTATLQVGSAAPDFELDSHQDKKWRLSDAKGKQNVVLVFYPFAFTPV